jgi:WD40 repeat protein
VAFSPDSGTLALASSQRQGLMATTNHRVTLWDLNTGSPAIELKGRTQTIGVVAFTPDGQTLATASDDGTVKLWDPVTGQERLTLSYEDRQPIGLLFTPDGQTLAVSWEANPRQKSSVLGDVILEAVIGIPSETASGGVVTLYRAAPRAGRPCSPD